MSALGLVYAGLLVRMSKENVGLLDDLMCSKLCSKPNSRPETVHLSTAYPKRHLRSSCCQKTHRSVHQVVALGDR